MPQQATVKSVRVKTGETDGRPWTNTQVRTIAGATLGSFEKGVATLKEGDIFEYEPEMDTEGRVNVKKGSFKLISQSTAPIQSSNGHDSRSNGSKSPEQLQIERASFEAQTAFKGVVEMLVAGLPVEKRAVDAAMNWAIAKLGGVPEQAAGRGSTPKQPAQRTFADAKKEKQDAHKMEFIRHMKRLQLYDDAPDVKEQKGIKDWLTINGFVVPWEELTTAAQDRAIAMANAEATANETAAELDAK